MNLTSPFTQLFLPLAVMAVMFALGTTLAMADLRRVLAHPRGLLTGLLAHALLLPLLAFGVARALQLPGPLAIGLVIIAACPANPAVAIVTHAARGDTMLAVCLTAGASLLSVLTVPLFVNGALRLFPAGHGAVAFPVAPAALGLLLVATLPVLAGMRLRHRRPQLARALERHLAGAGMAAIALVIGGAVWNARASMLPALAAAGAPALLLNLAAVAAAWALAAAARLPRGQRIAVGLECGLQNFAMAAFIALTLLGDVRLLAPAVAYGLTMWLSAIGVLLLARRRAAPGWSLT